MSPQKSKKTSNRAAKDEAAVESIPLKQRMRLAARWFGYSCAKLSLGLLIGLVIYLIYLDAKVTRKFEGHKWQIPAQVYARPLQLSPQMAITRAQLETQVKALNYRKVASLKGPGEYTLSKQHLSLVRRAFDFPGRAETERWLSIEFAGGRVSRISDRQSNDAQTSVRLEPLLIERLLTSHREDREFLPLEDFPERFKDTLLLVEDRQFYHHGGVSPLAILRALWQNIRAGKTVQGGSTLTQQLAKNVYLNADRHLVRKINEAFYCFDSRLPLQQRSDF